MEDAEKFGVENTYDVQASIEDGTLLMLIWAADYAARKQGHNSISDELTNKFDSYGFFMIRLSKQQSLKPIPYPPNLVKKLYEELSHVFERAFPVRNKIGFAFRECTIGTLGRFKGLSLGKKYKEAIESYIRTFEDAFRITS